MNQIRCFDNYGSVLKCLYQWDANQTIVISGIPTELVSEVHFCNINSYEAIVVVPQTGDSDIKVRVPNILLQQAQTLMVYVCQESSESESRTLGYLKIPVVQRAKPADYIYTETETFTWKTLDARVKALEEGSISSDQIADAVEEYFAEHPATGGSDFRTDNSLIMKDGLLSVNTTDTMEQDNTLPITSAGVYSIVGNIEVLLKTI